MPKSVTCFLQINDETQLAIISVAISRKPTPATIFANNGAVGLALRSQRRAQW
jgi:hypothetical protein